MPIRPSGVMNTTKAAATTRQSIGTSHGSGHRRSATVLATASQVSHWAAVNVASGSVSNTCNAWLPNGVGATILGSVRAGAVRPCSSRNPASDPSRGWS